MDNYNNNKKVSFMVLKVQRESIQAYIFFFADYKKKKKITTLL